MSQRSVPTRILVVRGSPQTQWEVELRDGLRDFRGALPAVTVQGMLTEIERLQTPRRGLVPTGDQHVQLIEERVGQCLTRVLTPGAVAEGIGRFQQHRSGRHGVLCIDADGTLPWELLGTSGRQTPLEHEGVTILRRVSCATQWEDMPYCTRLRVQVWTPMPDDALTAEVIAHLQECGARDGFEVVVLHASQQPLPPAHGVADCLHIVGHGAVLQGQVKLLGDRERSPGDATYALSRSLSQFMSVSLEVCHAGTAHAMDRLAPRLVVAGARLVIAPAREIHTTAARTFVEAYYGRLVAGASTVEAVSRGRQAVGHLAMPHADGRWKNHLAFVAEPRDDRLNASWHPPGWPACSTRTVVGLPGMSSWLTRAHALAKEQGRTWVGVEHLAEAFVDVAPAERTVSARLELLKTRLPGPGSEFWRNLRIHIPDAWGVQPKLTPRMVEIGRGLQEGFDAEELWDLMLSDPNSGIHVATRDAFLPAVSTGFIGDPAVALQVLWGPYDGTVVRLRAGEFLGRYDADGKHMPAFPMFGPDEEAEDIRLVRRCLRWLGDSEIELGVRALLQRSMGGEQEVARTTRVHAKDVLMLTGSTGVRFLGRG